MVIDMNKTILRALLILLLTVTAVAITSGCRNEPEGTFVPPDYMHVPEIIAVPALPEGAEQIDRMVVAGDTVFITAWQAWVEGSMFSETLLFSMNIDGTNLMELPNYNPGSRPLEAEGGNVQINSISVDNDGNLWVVETGNHFRFNIPDDFVENPDEPWLIWEFSEDLGSFNAIRKLDRTGAEIRSVDISEVAAQHEWFWVQVFAIDGEGNIYVGTEDVINVLSPDGRPLFRLQVQNWVETLINLPDGSVAHVGWGDAGREFRRIDPVAGDWGESIEIPQMANTIMPGNDEFMFMYTDRLSLFGFSAETGESVRILDWIDSDVSPDGIANISFLDDGRLFLTNQIWRGTGGPTVEMIFLTRVPFADLPERTTLTLATFWLDWNVQHAIIDFNRTSTTHRIHVRDYSQYSTDDDFLAGLNRLTTEIITGTVPDILDVGQLPYQQYAARGLLMDMYQFIDADPEINRSDLMESAFRAAEINGELPYVFGSFGVFTVVGNPMVLGAQPGWTMEEFRTVLNANPQADMPMGPWLTRDSFLQMSLVLGMNNFVDWGEGTVNFDGGDFAELLEIANTFPPEEFHGGGGGAVARPMPAADIWEEPVDERTLIATGRQIMSQIHMGDFNEIQRLTAFYGGDIVFKGFPAENRDGNTLVPNAGTLAITTRSTDPDGAWSFVRTMLTEDFQRENFQWWGLPTNRAFFEERLADAINPQEEHEVWWDGVQIGALTQAQADQILELINSVSGTQNSDLALWEIVSEGASDFFNGVSTAQDAARIIQSRAAILVAERS